jgi:hypothetical protein
MPRPRIIVPSPPPDMADGGKALFAVLLPNACYGVVLSATSSCVSPIAAPARRPARVHHCGAVRELRATPRKSLALADNAAVPVGPPAASAEAPVGVVGIACPSCGSGNNEGSRFCMTCGATLDQKA